MKMSNSSSSNYSNYMKYKIKLNQLNKIISNSMIIPKLKSYKLLEHIHKMRIRDTKIIQVLTNLEIMMVQCNSMMIQVKHKKFKIYRIVETNLCLISD